MAKTSRIQQFQSLMNFVRSGLLLIGLWPLKQPNFLYRLLPFFMSTVTASIGCAVINFTIAHRANIPVMTQALGLSLTLTAVTLKLLSLNPNRKCVRILFETLEELTNQLSKDTMSKDLISGKFIIGRRLSTALTCITFTSVVAYMITPIISIIFQLSHGVHPITFKLAMAAKYPWTITYPSFLYFCHYTLEVIALSNAIIVTCGIDTYFMLCILQISWKFRAMSQQFYNLKDDDDHNATVQTCLKDYRKLLTCRDNIEKIFGPLTLWLLISSAIVLCSNMFQISKIKTLSTKQIYNFALYLGARSLQLFVYTWSGSVLTIESEKFRDAVYASNWPATGQRKFMTSILIMLTQKPLVISACSFTTIAVDLFPKTMNTAISYFLLLKTMEDKGS